MLDQRAATHGDNLSRFASVLRQLPLLVAPSILDLGCGTARCALAIQERWPDVTPIGLDCDQAALRHGPNAFAPVQADLRALPLHAGQFGLILIRHPDVDRAPESWRAAIQVTPALLCVGGILLVTCYSLAELDQIKHWLADATAKLSVSAQSLGFAVERFTPPDGVGHDRYPAAWRFAGAVSRNIATNPKSIEKGVQTSN